MPTRRVLLPFITAFVWFAPTAFAQTAITTNTTLSNSTTLGNTTISNGATLTLSGGANSAAGIVLGAASEPTAGLVISNGATLDNTGYALSVGTGGGESSGSLTISGAGTQVNTTWLGVGATFSTGSVTISEGASLVTTGDRSRIGGIPQITRVVGSATMPVVGTMTVTGAGSSWLSKGANTNIGAHGAGLLRVLDGGSVTFEQRADIGFSSPGFVEVRGAGSTINGDLRLGHSAPSVLTVAEGGKVSGTLQFGVLGNRSIINLGAAANEAAASAGVLDLSQPVSARAGSAVQLNTTASAAAPYYLTRTGTAEGAALAFIDSMNVFNTAGYNVFVDPVVHFGDTIVSGGTLKFAQGGTITGVDLESGTIGGAENVFSTGGVFVNGGVLDLGGSTLSVSTVSGAAFTLSGGTVQNGVLSATSHALRAGTVEATLAGDGAITKSTTGTVYLNVAPTATGGTHIAQGTFVLGAASLPGALTVAGGALDLNAGSRTLGEVTLDGGAIQNGSFSPDSLVVSSGSISASVVGSTGLLKTGEGTVTLSGNNTFTGATTLNAGTLQIGAGGTSGSLASSAVTNNGTLAFNRSDAITFATVISGSGSVMQSGNGTTTLTAENTYTGATTINAGTLQIGDGGTTGSLTTSAVTNNGTFAFNRSDAVAWSAPISGTGGVTKSGTNTLTLSGTNTYSGATAVDSGTLRAGAANTFSPDSAVTVASGATLALNNYNQTIGGLAGAGNVTLGSATLTSAQAGNTTFSGSISGTGGLTKTGAGTLTLSGTNGYEGTTVVNGGMLTLASGGSLMGTTQINVGDSSGSGSLTIAGGAIGSLEGTTASLDVGNNGAGTLSISSGEAVLLGLNLGTGNAGEGTLAVTGGRTFVLFSGTMAGSSGGTGAISVQDGELWLGYLVLGQGSGSTGSATVSGGVMGPSSIVLGEDGGTGSVTVSGGLFTTGTLSLGHSGGTGTFLLSGGTLDANNIQRHSTSSTLTFDGGTLITSGSGPDFFMGFEGVSLPLLSGGLTVDTRGANSGFTPGFSGIGGLTKVGGGTLTLSGANTYSGPTTVSAGILQAGGAGILSSDSAVTVASGAVLALNNHHQTIGGLAGAGNVTLGSATLTTAQAGNTTFSGVISGIGGLIKSGDGALTLSGANTYSGPTTVNAGTLTLGSDEALPSGMVLTVAGTGTLVTANRSLDLVSLAGTGSGTLALGTGSLTVGSGNTSTEFSGAITGSGALTKNGSGTLTLSGANTYSGATTVNGGTLVVATGGSIANPAATLGVGNSIAAALTIDGGSVAAEVVALGRNGGAAAGTFSMTGGTLTTTSLERWSLGSTATFDGGTVRAAADASLLINGFTAGSVTLAAGGLTIDTDGHSAAFSANTVLTGTGGLTKSGSGTLTLGAPHAYTGATTINAGTLALSAADSIADASSVTVASGATLSLENNSETINGLAGAGSVALGNGTLTVGSADASSVFSGALSGTGSLVKSGTGTLTLSGASSYSGGTTIAGGTLTVATGGVIDHVANGITVANTGTGSFAMTGGNVTVSSVVLGHDGGTGTATLNGGTLTTNEIARWSVPSTISFSGGTLRAADDTNALLNGFTSGSAVINAGGLTIDTDGHEVGFSANTVLTGVGGLTKTGAGTLTLSGPHAYSGATVVNAGTLVLGASNVLPPGTALTVSGSGTLDLSNHSFAAAALAGTGSGTLALGSGSLTVGSDNTSTSFSGAITGTGGLTKIGAGTLTLEGANGYSGATTVEAGALIVNGSLASALVTVDSGAMLGGGGSLGALTLASGGTLAPGNSPGTLEATSATFAGGGIFNFEINRATGGTAGADPGWDLLALSGGLTLTATAENPFVIAIDTLTLANVAGLPAGFSEPSYAFTFVTTGTGITGFDAFAFSFNTAGVHASLTGTWAVEHVANSLALVYTASAIPEPSTYAALAGLGALALALWRRRIRQK